MSDKPTAGLTLRPQAMINDGQGWEPLSPFTPAEVSQLLAEAKLQSPERYSTVREAVLADGFSLPAEHRQPDSHPLNRPLADNQGSTTPAQDDPLAPPADASAYDLNLNGLGVGNATEYRDAAVGLQGICADLELPASIAPGFVKSLIAAGNRAETMTPDQLEWHRREQVSLLRRAYGDAADGMIADADYMVSRLDPETAKGLADAHCFTDAAVVTALHLARQRLIARGRA